MTVEALSFREEHVGQRLANNLAVSVAGRLGAAESVLPEHRPGRSARVVRGRILEGIGSLVVIVPGVLGLLSGAPLTRSRRRVWFGVCQLAQTMILSS